MRRAMMGLAAASLCGLVVVAYAEEPYLSGDVLPTYPVERACRAQVADVLVRECVHLEQVPYDALKRSWTRIPLSTRQQCITLADITLRGFYQRLAECIEIDLQRREQANRPDSFRY